MYQRPIYPCIPSNPYQHITSKSTDSRSNTLVWGTGSTAFRARESWRRFVCASNSALLFGGVQSTPPLFFVPKVSTASDIGEIVHFGIDDGKNELIKDLLDISFMDKE